MLDEPSGPDRARARRTRAEYGLARGESAPSTSQATSRFALTAPADAPAVMSCEWGDGRPIIAEHTGREPAAPFNRKERYVTESPPLRRHRCRGAYCGGCRRRRASRGNRLRPAAERQRADRRRRL